MSKWAIRLSYDEPIWFTNGVEDLFDTEEDAIQAMNEEMVICEEAIADGFMEDFDFEDFRIVEIV
jgi:hypothetical protein